MGDSLIEVQVSNTLIYQASHFIEGYHVIPALPPIGESVWLSLCALFHSSSCPVMTGSFNDHFILKMPVASSSGIFLRRELL